MSVINNLRVLHWNCNGIDATKKSDISSFLSENSIDILSLNENHSSRPNISSFHKLYHQKSKDLIVYIRKNISFTILQKSTSNEYDFIVISVDLHALIFCYLRNGSNTSGISKLYEVIMEIQHTFQNFTVIGDLNARLSILGHLNRNAAGTSLENYLSEEDSLIVINEPNVYTFKRLNPHSILQYTYSVLDLCLASHSMTGRIHSFEVLNHSFGSDHYPLFLEISLQKTISSRLESQYLSMFPLRKYSLQHISYPPSFTQTLDVVLRQLSLIHENLSSADLWENVKKGIYICLKKEKAINVIGE